MWETHAACRLGPVRTASQGESRLRRIISMAAATQRRTADIVPDQPALHSTGHKLLTAESSDLNQRPRPERNASARSNSQTGAPRRRNSATSRNYFDMMLSELACKPSTGGPLPFEPAYHVGHIPGACKLVALYEGVGPPIRTSTSVSSRTEACLCHTAFRED